MAFIINHKSLHDRRGKNLRRGTDASLSLYLTLSSIDFVYITEQEGTGVRGECAARDGGTQGARATVGVHLGGGHTGARVCYSSPYLPRASPFKLGAGPMRQSTSVQSAQMTSSAQEWFHDAAPSAHQSRQQLTAAPIAKGGARDREGAEM